MIDRPVGEVLKDLGSPGIVAVTATTTVTEAVATMNQKGLGSVLVRDARGAISGIFTERDLMRRVVGEGRDPRVLPISSVMTANVRSVPSTQSVVETLRIMLEHGYRHMLVDDGGKPGGLLSIRDLMRWMILPDAPIAHEGRRGVIRTRADDAARTLREGG